MKTVDDEKSLEEVIKANICHGDIFLRSCMECPYELEQCKNLYADTVRYLRELQERRSLEKINECERSGYQPFVPKGARK